MCRDGHPCCEKKNCQEEENYARRECADDPLTLVQELKRSMLECILTGFNKKSTPVVKTWNVYQMVCSLKSSNLIETSETKLPKFVQSLVENCNELSAYRILTAISSLRRFLKAANVPKEESLG
ncbi:hypothetical protein AVEN_91496-1 [Araneus ventricosus]|uniref:Uncharacterized protein n=1 Tax=Araneus ventricosus TaxID=182803 RepID=A0A4Y2BJD4_ARAVE|nr:hypothetical protein AVEN_91496-1 [Araneus ventricosus]